MWSTLEHTTLICHLLCSMSSAHSIYLLQHIICRSAFSSTPMMIISRRLVVEDSARVSPRLERILARFDSVNRVIMAGELVWQRRKVVRDKILYRDWKVIGLGLWRFNTWGHQPGNYESWPYASHYSSHYRGGIRRCHLVFSFWSTQLVWIYSLAAAWSPINFRMFFFQGPYNNQVSKCSWS